MTTKTIKDNSEILAFFEESGESDQDSAITAVEQISQKRQAESEPKTIAQDLFKQKQFFRRLCYEPVWTIDSITNPSELIFSAQLASNFLLKLETGIHRIFQESLKDYIILKIFDLDKGVELKQVSQVKHRATFFTEIEQQRKFIAFVDGLPLHFAIRPECAKCGVTFDLINPMSRNDMPFWAHSTRKSKKLEVQSDRPACRNSESLWGEFPNTDNRQT